jgi:hypothetical protein
MPMATHAHSTPASTIRRSPASRAWTEHAIATLIEHLDSLDASSDDMEPDDDNEDTDGCEPEEDCCVDDPSPYWPGVRIVSDHRGPV